MTPSASATHDPVLRLRGLWLATGYALVFIVVYLSITSTPVDIELDVLYEDKLFHALAYFSLMFWFAQIYHQRLQRNAIAVIFVLQGVLMEFIQSYDIARTSEYADMMANTVGVLLAYVMTRNAARFMLVRMERLVR